MLTFNLFRTANIQPCLDLVYLGIEMEILEPKAIQDFIYWKMGSDIATIDEDFDIISITPSKLDVMEMYNKRVTLDIPEAKELTKAKLRLAILEHLNQESLKDNMLLEKIEEVYALFDYPEDMNSFIYYMPSSTYSENPEASMINNFHLFLEEERARLLIKEQPII